MMSETKSKSDVDTASRVTATPTYTSTGTAKPSSGITLCVNYFRTVPGVIKLIELFLGMICMACTAPAWTTGTHWFLFVVVTAFVSTSIWCFIYLLNLKHAISLPIDWLLTELLNTSITTLLFLIAVIVQFCSIERAPGRNITGGVFGVFNMLVYAVGCFYLYRDWKDTHPNSSFSGSVLRRNP